MVFGQVVTWVLHQQQIAGHQVSTLVQQLEEGMLHIGAHTTPDHRSTAGRQKVAGCIHALAIAFHVQLLQVGRQQLQALVVGHDGVGLGTQYLAIPDLVQGEAHRNVDAQRRT